MQAAPQGQVRIVDIGHGQELAAYIDQVDDQSASDLWIGGGQQAEPILHVLLPDSLIEDLRVAGWKSRVPVRNLYMAHQLSCTNTTVLVAANLTSQASVQQQ